MPHEPYAQSSKPYARRLTTDYTTQQVPPIPERKEYYPRTRDSYRRHEPAAESLDPTSDGTSESSASSVETDPFEDNAKLGHTVAQLEHQLLEVQNRLNQAKTELALEQFKRPTQYDDHYFKSQLTGLRHLIREWSVTYFSHSEEYTKWRAEVRFKRISDDWTTYMKYQRPWLIQARLWDIIQRHLFDPKSSKLSSYLFAGRGRKHSVEKMFTEASQDGTDASRAAYRNWRTATYSLLFPGKGHNINPASYMQDDLDHRISQLQRKLWRSLWPYAMKDIPTDEKTEAKEALHEIVSNAFFFDLDMKKHTADMAFSLPTCELGSKFDHRQMEEAVDKKGEGRIRLIVSPPLCRTAPGSRLIAKAQVSLGFEIIESPRPKLDRRYSRDSRRSSAQSVTTESTISHAPRRRREREV